ncbi:tyrosine-protein kinase [Spirosoma arcticum]
MLGIAHIYLLWKQPVYSIKASLLVQDQQKGSDQTNSLKELGVFTPNQVVDNETEILHSFTLMNRVVDRLNLDVRYFQSATFGKREIYDESPIELFIEEGKSALYEKPLKISLPGNRTVRLSERTYPLNKFVETPYGRLKFSSKKNADNRITELTIQVSKRSSTVKGYLANLRATPVGKNSSIIQLSLEDAVPVKGEAVLNQLITEYNQATLIDKNKVAASTLKFIENRLGIVSRELSTVEKNVESYKSNQGITDLSVQAQSFLETVQQNDALLNQVTIQLAALNDLQKYVDDNTGNQGNTPAVVGINDPVLLGLITNLTQLEQQREQLARTTSAQNPLLQTIDSQIRTTKNNMAGNIRTMKTMLVSTQRQYQTKNGQVEGAIRTIPQKERLLMDITRQQAIKNNLYTYLLQKREETAVAFASTIADTRTIDPALSDEDPIKPTKFTLYALFGLLGLVLPIAAIAGHNALNDRVMRRIDVEEITEVPILGELVKENQSRSPVMAYNTNSLIAEQIRMLRTDLQSMKNGLAKSQVILFTSSIGGEGKTFVSMNVGASLASIGKPTIVVDLDLRMPKLHKVFNLSNSIGMSDYLRGDAALDAVIQPVPGYPNCFIIPSGALPANPSELLSGARLSQLVQELRERFNYVILDTPPVGLVSDARIIAPCADATFFIIRHDVTQRNHLKMINKLYQEQKFQNMNIVLNATDGSNSYLYGNGQNNSYFYRQVDNKNRISRR